MNVPKSGMGRLQTRVEDYDYNECDRSLADQLIHWLDNEGIISDILRKVSALEDIDDATSE